MLNIVPGTLYLLAILVTGETGTGYYLRKIPAERIVLDDDDDDDDNDDDDDDDDDGIQGYFLESFLQLASTPDSPLTTLQHVLHEDNFVKVIPVFLAKDAMQTKSGLSFDGKQKQLVGN